MTGIFIRRPQREEHDSVRAVVQTVVDEIYGGLWAPSPLPVDEENWHSSWVAVRDAKIIGVVRTSGEWLDDLWVLRESRGYGAGQRLLAQGEAGSPRSFPLRGIPQAQMGRTVEDATQKAPGLEPTGLPAARRRSSATYPDLLLPFQPW